MMTIGVATVSRPVHPKGRASWRAVRVSAYARLGKVGRSALTTATYARAVTPAIENR
jgi:hypothetical protein